MALLSKKGMQSILTRIMETGGLTDAMEDDVKKITDDFDEREGILKTFGEVSDNDETYEFKENEKPKTYETEYKELKEKYYDRFFGRGGNDDADITSKEDVLKQEDADVVRDGTTQTFDDLLESVEG